MLELPPAKPGALKLLNAPKTYKLPDGSTMSEPMTKTGILADGRHFTIDPKTGAMLLSIPALAFMLKGEVASAESMPNSKAMKAVMDLPHDEAIKKPRLVEIQKPDKLGNRVISDEFGNDFTVRDVPLMWKPAITAAYKANPKIPKGLLEATLMQESSMGTTVKGDVAQLDDIANKALGYKTDAKTPAESIKRMGEYYTKIAIPFVYPEGHEKAGESTEYKNELRLYKERYNKNKKDKGESGQALSFDPDEFSAFMSYYGAK